MSRFKTFDSTGLATAGRLYAGDLNAIQDLYADLVNYSQNHGVGTLAVGEAGLQLLRYGAGEARLSGAMRVDGILRGLGGLFAGAYTTTQRDAITAGSRPFTLVIFNTTTNQFEYNAGTDATPNWQPIAPAIGTGSITSAMIADGTIVNADVAAAAAIVYSKLSLTNSIVNADIAAAAAIVYSKLSLTNSILNADIAAAAAIAYSKLNLANSIVHGDIAAANKDGVAGTPSMRTLGTGAQQAAAGNDARLSDQRTPLDNSVTQPKLTIKYDRGTAASITGGGTQINFTTAFTAAPVVVSGIMIGNPAANGGSGEPANYTSSVDGITSAHFNLYHSQGGTRTVPWVAIGA